MKIIISPAKKMKSEDDFPLGTPVFIEKAEQLMRYVRSLSYEDAKRLWACNDKIAGQNYVRFQQMDLRRNLTPAILSYDGIQYSYMAPGVFSYGEFDYVQENLRILSGFYGVLKPMDGVTPYRLEMQAKVALDGCQSLYDFWGACLYQEVIDESRVIINLASKEYSRCVEKHLQPGDRFITVVFGEGEKIVQKGVYAKIARGEMVRYMAEQNITDPERIKLFDRGGYRFREDMSTVERYVFIR